MHATIGLCTLVLLLCGTIDSAYAQQTERRVAQVIGNAGYQHVDRLANPINDAKFALVGGGAQQDVGKPKFDQQIQSADVALFYYAGHGMQVQGTNWLLPVDANRRDHEEARRWFEKASAAGNEAADAHLARLDASSRSQ